MRAELVLPVITSTLIAAFAAPRWFRCSAPWVGLLEFAAIYIGFRELYGGWSPTWSHQTRANYVLSQLFGTGQGCSDSECLYLLFFGYPFLCLTAYSAVSLIALGLTHKRQMPGDVHSA